MNVLVASKNPVKIDAAKEAFSALFPDSTVTVTGASVSSGVADQPMSIEETRRGARNRVDQLKGLNQEADYYVGIEGGIFQHDEQLEVMAILHVEDSTGRSGESMTATFTLPPEVTELVHSGLELGDANDQVFNEHNSKQKGGAIGLLTDDLITRKDYYVHALTLALIPFAKPQLYDQL